MQVSSSILLPGESIVAPAAPGNAPDDGQFAGLVSASLPPAGGTLPGSSQPDTPAFAITEPGALPETALIDNAEGPLQSDQPALAPAVVGPVAETRAQLPGAKALHLALEQVRLSVAADLPESGKSLPVAADGEADPALVPDTGEMLEAEGEASAAIDVAVAATMPVPAQVTLVADTPAKASASLTESDDAAASDDTPETPAAPAPLRRDAAPRPAELEQLRGGRAQDLAWEQAQQTMLAPARQPLKDTAQPALGEIALPPDTVKDAREGASTAQLLAGADGTEKGELKTLKELREARLAAAPAAAAKAASAETASSSPFDAGSAARPAHGPVHGHSAAPTTATDTSLAQLVDRLIETRVAARSERSQIELTHPDFGRVTLAVGLRADDRLSIDLPGAPSELRHAVGQALAQQGAAQASGQNSGQSSGQNTGNNGSQTSGQRAEGQGQAAFAGGENPQNGAGHNGGSGKNTYEPDNAHLSIFAQSQAAGSDRGAGRSAGGPESGSRRGVLA
ncbi:hypothetical protein D2V17_17450 [Aurantiacibacter xanthus]|uniref:Flagellar hook-length control protein FliK n=1 Tax=Aurantiacibacter xanthus TaxID=1784712 RepID=A0A3A1P444_9SPHN|nr:hypothetical protein [Aurantiacibacter xanthus]RIV81333.1 hypothetical protein D2V17_17450 [Aurantiacibacter xanthus]